MGCDIHTFVEMKNKDTGKWEWVRGAFPMPQWVAEADDIPQAMKDRWYPNGKRDDPFEDRDYGMFAWLAGVRNYSGITPLRKPRGLPEDVSPEVEAISEEWGVDGHTHTWWDAKELLEFDYDLTLEDRRVTVQIAPNAFDGGATAPRGRGQLTTYRRFLPDDYFQDLAVIRQLFDMGECRVVAWFDN